MYGYQFNRQFPIGNNIDVVEKISYAVESIEKNTV
jgi:hypothetical protein